MTAKENSDKNKKKGPSEIETTLTDTILERTVEKEITQSYIDYAMSVIVSRALPDVRDGLKPVLRRILYTMYEMRLLANSKHKKSMGVVGQTLRDYHPHGDSSVYDAMVRMAQPFAMRYPMIDGQGNFGSIDGDGAAAPRYTEARMTKLAEEMLQDIQMETVDWRDNYDQTNEEPIVVPTKFPYTLCNGTMGIAVGMATNMAPHNLNEVLDACLLILQEEEEVSIDAIMEIIKGPDFPTGGYIFDSENIREVYGKGRGGIVTRGKVSFEENKKGGQAIVITEMPYQVNKSKLVAKIGDLVHEGKLDGVTDITDESNRDEIRVVIKLSKKADKENMLIRLYKYTDLQTNFNINNVALIERGKQPRPLNIKELLVEFVEFRREVVLRRSQYQLKKAQNRLHILEGLKRAIDVLDEVIETIKGSDTRQEAKDSLMKKFEFSDDQTEYILKLRLQTLVGLEIKRILDEIGERKDQIEYLLGIVNNPKKRDGVVADEMHFMKKEYGDERRTELVNNEEIYDLKKKIRKLKRLDDAQKEPVFAWINNDYKIKVLYQTRVIKKPEDTFILTQTDNQDKMIAMSDQGELVIERLKDLGKHTTNSKPLDVVKEFGIKHDLIFAITLSYDFDFLVFVTDKNNVKKIKKELILKFRKFPTTVMRLEKGEKIRRVIAISKGDKIGLISQKGKVLIFSEGDVRPMGKTAGGVKGIDLASNDKIADVFLYTGEPFVFIHDGKNGKLVAVDDIRELKVRGEMKRAQAGIDCAKLKKGMSLKGAMAMTEGSVNLVLSTGRIDKLDSDDIDLKMPEEGLSKITNSEIVQMYRPWDERDAKRRGDAGGEEEDEE